MTCSFTHIFDGGSLTGTSDTVPDTTEASYYYGRSSFSMFHDIDFNIKNYIAEQLTKRSENISGNFKGVRRDDNENIVLKVIVGTFVNNKIDASSEDIWNFGSPDVAPQSDIKFTLGGLTCERLSEAPKE